MDLQTGRLTRRRFLGAAAGATALAALPVGGPASAGPTVAADADIACWGDSLTYGVGGVGTTYPGVLAAELGVRTYNGGVVGERSSGIACRQGGRTPPATFVDVGEDLAPGTFRVVLDRGRPFYDRTMVIQEEGVLPGAIGGVHGLLNKQGNYANEFTPYYFTRDDGLVVPPPGSYVADVGPVYADVPPILWAGHNDLRLVDAPRLPGYAIDIGVGIVLTSIGLMVEQARARTPDRFLVLSLLNGKRAGNGSVTGRPSVYHRTVVQGLNPQLAQLYGPEHYLDVRTWLVQDALAYGGLTPTEQDLRDIQEDIPPSQLTVPSPTDPHLNPTGYTLVARYLADAIRERGWFPAA